MTDKTLIFTIGLTDEIDNDGEWIVHSEHERPEYCESYNLYRQNPEVEKESLSWKLNMENPLVVKLIEQWEKTIRKPHLKMINTQHKPFHLNKDYFDIDMTLEHLPLLPEEDLISLSNSELLDCGFIKNQNQSWGSLVLYMDKIYNHNNINTGYLRRQIQDIYDSKIFDVDEIDTINNRILEIPSNFSLNLNLIQFKKKSTLDVTFKNLYSHHQDIFNEYEDKLIEIGYDKESYTKLLISESLLVGEPQDSPTTLYETFSKYPTVCRTSLTKEK
tara:strand:+ start:354 stop:1175 length:822 start_codon:yes stop_codon:yes gene_type:complete